MPVLGDSFIISTNHTVTISQSMSVGVVSVQNIIGSGAILRVAQNAVCAIEIAGTITGLGTSQLQVGIAGQPITGDVSITIYATSGSVLMWPNGSGLMSFVGNVARDRCSRVVGNYAAGVQTFQVRNAANWQVGDRIVISEGSTAFGIDTTITSIAGTTVGVPALSAPISDTAPIVNLTSNVRVGIGASNALNKLLVNQYTNSRFYFENALFDASYSSIILTQTWDRMYAFSSLTTVTKSAFTNNVASGVGGINFAGVARDMAIFSRRTEGSVLTLDNDCDIDGMTVISNKTRNGIETVEFGANWLGSIFGVLLKNVDIVGSANPVLSITGVSALIDTVRAFCWNTVANTVRIRPYGGKIKNFDTRRPGEATLGATSVFDGRVDTVVENAQTTYVNTTPSGFGGSWMIHAVGAESTRGRISIPGSGTPPGATGALRIVGTATTVPVIVNPEAASLSGKIALWFYRDAGSVQAITISGSSVSADVVVPTATQVWHKIEVPVAAADQLSITSVGIAPYWIHGCKIQRVGLFGNFYGHNLAGTVQIADARTVLTEVAALALPVAVNHATQTIAVNGAITGNQLWHALSADISTIANLGLSAHFELLPDGSVTTTYSIAFGASGSIDGAVTAANGKTSALQLQGLSQANVLLLDGAGDVFGNYVAVSGTHKILLPFASSGTWTWVVKRAGYEHAVGTFDPSLGGVTDARPSTPQKVTPEGQPMFTAAPSALVTVNIGDEAAVSIGDGMASLQGTFDAIEISLMTLNGMRWIAGGGDDCSIFNSAGGDYLFLTAGWRLKRDSIMSSNAGINAFVVSTEGVPVDESNGPVRFLTSDATTSIAAAVRAALIPDLAALALQVWEVTATGNKTPGTTGAALQDTSARVAAGL